GPSRALVGPTAHLSYVTVAHRRDYRAGHRAIQRILAISEARGWEPETSHARFMYALNSSHWFEPLEETVRQACSARDGLIQGGDLGNAGWNYYPLVYGLLDVAPTLDSFAVEVDAALSFCARTGNEHGAESLRAYRQVAAVMRDEPVASAIDEAASPD